VRKARGHEEIIFYITLQKSFAARKIKMTSVPSVKDPSINERMNHSQQILEAKPISK
jgi:hypothetical protein